MNRKLVILALVAMVALVEVSFIPTLRLNTGKMSQLAGQWVTVYYETEEAAAKDVFLLAEAKAEHLLNRLGVSTQPKLNIFIYDNQATFQTKKYGMLARFLGLDWYVGDNRGTDVLLTSPARPGFEYGYKDVKETVLHEMVHAYNSVLNPEMPLWLDEGVASYLTNGNPPASLADYYDKIPSFKQIQTNSPLVFANIGGYDFAYAYVRYLDLTYGWERVLLLSRTGSYEQAFGKTAKSIYDDWVTTFSSGQEQVFSTPKLGRKSS